MFARTALGAVMHMHCLQVQHLQCEWLDGRGGGVGHVGKRRKMSKARQGHHARDKRVGPDRSVSLSKPIPLTCAFFYEQH